MMTARPRRSFTPEFKAQTVDLIRSSSKSVGEVCRDLDLTETAVRRWIAQADIDAGRRDGLTTAEREELTRLRRENRVLREERDILKKVGMPLSRHHRAMEMCGAGASFERRVGNQGRARRVVLRAR
jgi:transposase